MKFRIESVIDDVIEADSMEEAAEIYAEKHSGMDEDDTCEDPFSFTVYESDESEGVLFVAEVVITKELTVGKAE